MGLGPPGRSLGTRGVVAGRGLAHLLEARQLRLVHKHDEGPSKVRLIQVRSARSSVETPSFVVMPTFVQSTVFTTLAGTLSVFPPSPKNPRAKTERGIPPSAQAPRRCSEAP